MTSRDLRRPEVTRKRRHLTGGHLEGAVEGQKLAYTAHFTSYKAVARRRRQSRHRRWCHRELRLPEVTRRWCYLTGSHLKVAVEGQKRPETTFHFLQGCSSQEEAITWQEMMSHDLSWPKVTGSDVIWTEVTRKWM